jgi:hypothetical protein
LTRFERSELIAFLRAIDRSLRRRTSIVVIGGAAAAVGYHAGVRTADIDLWQGLSNEVLEAAARARHDTGMAVAVGSAAVADLPANYEDRLRPVRGLRLRNLAVWIPDKYDLTLSKAVRGYQHDLDAIEGIHRHHRLSQATLIARFEAEMTAAIADPRRVRLNVAMVVARLFGLAAGRRLAERWGVPAPGAR